MNAGSWTDPISRAASARSRRPSLAGRPRHRLDHEPRRVEVLRGPRSGEKCRRSGADREVLEVAELLDLPQRIDARFARQIQQRLGSHAEIGIAQHRRHPIRDLIVLTRAQDGQRPRAGSPDPDA